MKDLLKLILILAPMASEAQITITQADFPAINERWVHFHDVHGGQTITAGGANMIWDYTSSFTVADTFITLFQSPSVVPSSWSALYPNATRVLYSPVDSFAEFFKANTTGFYYDGNYCGSVRFPQYATFSPEELILPAPFTYNSSRLNPYKEVIFYSGSGVAYKDIYSSQQQFTADAWGNLTTPAGNFANTLRVKQVLLTSDSSFVDTTGGTNYVFENLSGPSSSFEYDWYKNGTGTLIMTLLSDPGSFPFAYEGDYYDDNSHVGISENSVPASSVVAYPNPATTGFVNFNIANSESETITIFNALGVVIKKVPIEGANKLRFSTDYFTSGAYLYTVCDKNGTVIQSDRFLIIK